MTNTTVSTSAKIDRLFNLLPTSYRQRDVEEGSALQMLLRVVAEQVNIVEQDIAQLYNNWFIETCQDWVVPYIADLIGFVPVAPPDLDDQPSTALENILVPRREVANTIRYRRRKGTLSLLQDLANSVSGWPALVVEFDHRVNVTQALDHLHVKRGRLADLRNMSQLNGIGSAFDVIGHSVELRGIDSTISQGRYNSAAVGILISRLRARSVTRSLAYCVEEVGDNCFSFSILGNDTPLYARNDPGAGVQDSSIDAFPVPIERTAFRNDAASGEHAHASTSFYGEEKGLAIWAKGWSDCDPALPIPASRIIPADLTDWRYEPQQNHVAVDPRLGRITFPATQLPPGDVHVSYNYGSVADIGGGEYARVIPRPAQPVTIYEVGASLEFSTIHSAVERWQQEKPRFAAIEIADSGVYQEQIHLTVGERQSLSLRAASGSRPVLLTKDWHPSRPDAVIFNGEAHSQLTLDGIMIAGRDVHLSGEFARVTIRHTTLVPGWSLHGDAKPRKTGEPSLHLNNLKASVDISHSIVGGIQILQESDEIDPIDLHISNSIVDAHHARSFAISAPDGSIAAATLKLRNCTIAGRIEAHSIELAQNTIFLGPVLVARRQQGCVRFCYVPRGSRTPRRYHCQPDLVEQAAEQEAHQQALSADEAKSLSQLAQARVEPLFESTSFGTPHYFQLTENCAVEVSAGGSDQSEMGVYHDLYQPQRLNNLRQRLSNYTPAGTNVGVIFVT